MISKGKVLLWAVIFCLILAARVYVGPTLYVETDRGFISEREVSCTLGMLTNTNKVNILDEEGKPITCSGYVNLNNKQKLEYEATH